MPKRNAEFYIMITQTIRSWKEFDELASEWGDLLARAESSSVFLTWEWIRAWRNVGETDSPFAVIVRDDTGKLMGVAPLYVAEFRVFTVIRCRALRYMADVATGAEYPDWIVAREVSTEVAAAISQELAAQRSEWDVIWLTCVAGWVGVRQRIIEAARQSKLLVKARECLFSAFDLPATMQEFEASFSSRRRQQMRRISRRVAAIDGVEYVRCDSAKDVPEYLESLFDLHQQRWAAVGLDGCFRRKPQEAEFYRQFAGVAYQKGWLAIYGVRENGILKAVQFGYVYDGTFLQIQEGYDPNFHKSVGNALRHFVISDCIARGLDKYDFLAGISEHKRRWSAGNRDGFDVLIGSGGLKSRILFACGLWPTGRFIQQS